MAIKTNISSQSVETLSNCKIANNLKEKNVSKKERSIKLMPSTKHIEEMAPAGQDIFSRAQLVVRFMV